MRELRNVVERAIYRWSEADGAVDHIIFDPFASPWRPRAEAAAEGKARKDLADSVPEPAEEAIETDFDAIDDLKAATEAYERTIVEHALAKHRYNQRQTAKALGLSYDQLRHCIKKHDLAS